MPVGSRACTGVRLHFQPVPRRGRTDFIRTGNLHGCQSVSLPLPNGVHGLLADTPQCLLWHACVCFKSELRRATEKHTTRVQGMVSLESYAGSDRWTSKAELSRQPCHTQVTTPSHVSPAPLQVLLAHSPPGYSEQCCDQGDFQH